MYAILKRPDQPDSVIIGIDQAQQLEQLRAWMAPDVTLSLPKEAANEPDYSTLSADDFKEIEAAFAKAVKQLPIGKVVTQSSSYFEFSSPEDFRLFCSNNGIFKGVWAPHLNEQ